VTLHVVDRLRPASSDAELVAACLRGDRTAERELFRREYGRAHAVAYRILGSTRDLDDILQETFIAVFRGLPRFRGDAKLSTWIDRITVHVVLDHIRARRRLPVLLETVELPAPGGSLADRSEARDGLRRLYAVLDRLPADARIA
jgi:RNA polymerase sigma-70 factor (ECF subfamily)